jgi:hypothetical protein
MAEKLAWYKQVIDKSPILENGFSESSSVRKDFLPGADFG